jgi:phosphotransferase system enzyme I (PtsP)
MAKPVVTVHHRGDRGVDGILRLIELASHDGPLETMLTAMCDELAAIAGVDIASVYVREDETLVMRGNHGFPASAIGTVLAVGEGITGLVAECMRPVSAAHAAAEAAYKEVPGLGEERFPVFAGVPLISGGGVIGVLVLQRRKKPFAADEVTLATALGAPITLAIERRRASAVRSARLHGTGHGGAIVLGRAGIVPTTTALAAATALEAHDVDRALDRFALALADQRLRERLIDAVKEPTGLRAVVRDYARAPYRLGTESEADRAAEIEELCALIGVTCDDRTTVRHGAIWIADTAGAFVTIAAVARGAAALVTTAGATPSAIAIARTAHLPLVTDVAGLFSWARPGDLLAADGDTGTVLVHPAPTDIERLRRER